MAGSSFSREEPRLRHASVSLTDDAPESQAEGMLKPVERGQGRNTSTAGFDAGHGGASAGRGFLVGEPVLIGVTLGGQ